MTLVIDSRFAGKTIKELLYSVFGYSTGMVKRLKFMEGGITVNGEFVTVRHTLAEGEVLRLRDEDREEDTSPYIIPSDISIEIAYEDKSVTVVNKPPDMPSHPSLGHKKDTVANALAARYTKAPYVFRPVNRLDRDTSGLMLTANTRLSASKLYRSMIAGDIHKLYIAVLDGEPEGDFGEIRTFMARCDDSIIKRRISAPDEDGAKEAVTLYRVAAKCGRYSAVIASPLTGRTHQLRVHFAHIGCPITGDFLYGERGEDISRHALNASFLSFPHPETGETLSLFSGLPEDMAALLSPKALSLAESALRQAANDRLSFFIPEE